MKALSQVGNKSSQTPKLLWKLVLLMFLGTQQACTISITPSGTIHILPDTNNSLKLCGSVCALSFLWHHCPSSPSQMFQGSLQRVLQQKQALMLTLHHQGHGLILLMWGRDQGQSSHCHSMSFGGAGLVILGMLLKGPSLTLYVKANCSCDSCASGLYWESICWVQYSMAHS